MSTSLTEQLQKLKAPQTNIYRDEKKRDSLLFSPNEAVLKDRETFYEIGISGLKELIALYEGFRMYEDTLFGLASKDFERAVQTKEINENLNRNIENFLMQLSPYLLLQSSHKALEWLVNRYQIHEYNQDAIMSLILPFFETKIFVRFVQIMDIKQSSNRWNWLEPIQKSGVPLTKQVLHKHCSSNSGTLRFIAKSVRKYVKVFGERASQLKTIFPFFCTTVIGTADCCKKITQSLMSALLPTLYNAIGSPVIDYRSSAYVIIGYLSTKSNIKEKTLNEIINKIFDSTHDLTYDVVVLINLIYSTQTHISKISDIILYDMTIDKMHLLCTYFKKLIESKVNVYHFTLKFLMRVLPLLQVGNEEFRRFYKLPEMLIEEVDFKSQHPDEIIRCVLDAFHPIKSNTFESDESDIEILENDDENSFTSTIIKWYSQFLRSLEKKYPQDFDEVITKEMGSESGATKSRRAQLTKVLGFKPAIVHRIGDTTLFENLDHVNASFRVEAVKYICKHFHRLKLSSVDFLRESLINKLNDDEPQVIKAVLKIPADELEGVLTEEDLKYALLKTLSKFNIDNKKWRSIVKSLIQTFCRLERFPITQETVLALFPFLFPEDEASGRIASSIINSNWGKRFILTRDLNLKDVTNHEVICIAVFNVLCVDRTVGFDDILDFLTLNRHKTLDICIYLLLKSCTLEKSSIEENMSFLDILRDSVISRQIVTTDDDKFLSISIPQFIALAREDKIPFRFFEYLLIRVIEDVKIGDISKPWCDLCSSSPEMIFIKKMFDICITGCYIKNYSTSYLKLFHKLLNIHFATLKEKLDFIAAFACGHILYATKPEDVIDPVLQMKALKFFKQYISANEGPEWIIKSDVVITMILFNLNNPLPTIREATIMTIKTMLQFATTNNLYDQLLKKLIEYEEEVNLDNEQILQVLRNILVEGNVKNKQFQKKLLQQLLEIVNVAPPHVGSELLRLLSEVNNASVLSLLMPAFKSLTMTMKLNIHNPKFLFNIYESKLLINILNRINPHTVSNFANDDDWSIVKYALQEFKEMVLDGQTLISPSVLIMKQINEDAFKNIPENRLADVVKLICFAGTFSNNPSICSVASKTMKRINLHFNNFKPILQSMLEASDARDTTNKKKKTSISMLSYQVAETEKWKLGVTLLEYIQSKKKMIVDNSFVSMLFSLLKKCLFFEEQSYVEYTKQLILSSIWYYCTKFVDDEDINRVKSLKTMFDINLIVQCIRGTQNPQTHHHALMLLSHAAYMLPEQVLHHTLEIFTFMGSSVLRHDDAYSFQIISKTIETLIPIIVKLDKNISDYDQNELQHLQSRVVPVLRVFADVVLGVPEHRRLPLYKKLVDTLDANKFLWVFVALLLEAHLVHEGESKEKFTKQKRNLADQEAPVNRLDFGQSIIFEFPPEVILKNIVKLLVYVKSLPIQKDEDAMDADVDSSEIFSVSGHTALQLRHYRYIIITFLNTCLASPQFVQHMETATDLLTMETQYKKLVVNILAFLQIVTKVKDEKVKYWRVMERYSFDLLDNANNLLSAPMFLSVVKGLLLHNVSSVRRKSMEMLNMKIKHCPEVFKECNKKLMFSLLPILIKIINTPYEGTEDEEGSTDLQVDQQTALFSLKLMARMLAPDNPEPFIPVVESITGYVSNSKFTKNVMASVFLCLAELCSTLKTHILKYCPIFMPAFLKLVKEQRKSDTPDFILHVTITALQKIIESVPSFLGHNNLVKIVYEYSLFSVRWSNLDQKRSNINLVLGKLTAIKEKIATAIEPRVLIPVLNETYYLLRDKGNFKAIGPFVSLLAENFKQVTEANFTELQQMLTTFFLSTLELRSVEVENNMDPKVICHVEDEVINALVCLLMKLRESTLKSFYFKIYDWAVRTNVDGQKHRVITFYRLNCVVSAKLQKLQTVKLFGGMFIKNSADFLDACNKTKSEELFFDSEENCSILVESILKTLHILFLYEDHRFINKERFDTLMQPLVDQLENPIGGIEELKLRAENVLIPCISQFAVAVGDDSLWKLLNYQILLKTRHNDAEIRLIALDCLVSTASKLGSNWLPLLAESIPFVAELLEDGDSKIEASTKNAIRTLEQILDEPLEKYF